MISLRADLSGFLRTVDQFHPRAERAITMGGGSGLRAMRAEASRQIRARKGLRVAVIGRYLSMQFATGGGRTWTLSASTAPVRVIDYFTRQAAGGISVEINRGAPKTIKGAFYATMGSGHRGVFYRLGKARLPIDEAYSSRVSDVMMDAKEPILARGVEVFQRTVTRNLAR